MRPESPPILDCHFGTVRKEIAYSQTGRILGRTGPSDQRFPKHVPDASSRELDCVSERVDKRPWFGRPSQSMPVRLRAKMEAWRLEFTQSLRKMEKRVVVDERCSIGLGCSCVLVEVRRLLNIEANIGRYMSALALCTLTVNLGGMVLRVTPGLE